MEVSSSYKLSLSLFLILFHQLSHCQQDYLNETGLNCSTTLDVAKGYLCDIRHLRSCNSFVTFRSESQYDTAIKIAYLLGSEASEIASVNNISSLADKIPTNKLIIVPISCQCSGNIFQHTTPYTARNATTYFNIAKETYQGLTTCQALIAQNYYDAEEIPIGAELMVPVRCACPSQNQTASGVVSLLTYIIGKRETATSIGKTFGVNAESILEANMLSQDSFIYESTPILVPLKNESCSAYPGMFFCNCPNGHLVNGISGLTCISEHGKSFPTKLVTLLALGIGFALSCLFLSGYKLYQWLDKRRIKIRKEQFFKQNGGLLLQEKSSYYGSCEKAKLFTAEEIQRATDNYNQSRFLGQGGYGAVYKGMLPDGTIVAVKRSKAIEGNQIQQFINEVLILSQINHRNIVKLLGCCLETETPLVVYEYISNGTLLYHIRKKEHESKLSWENRLSIACDVAGALAYMHSSASIPIFHRDIKSSNILLDDKYKAKVSDFGTSRSVPEDKTHLTTAVQGTFGYMDPEYFQLSQFTDKSDVYSFGVTLAELLTGETPYSFAKDHEEKNLISTFISSTRENLLSQVLDPQVAKDAPKEDVQAMAELATRCLRLSGKKRPTMKQVSMELEGLRKSETRVLETVDQEHELLKDEEKYSCMNATSSYTIEDPTMEQSTDISLEIEYLRAKK